MKCPRCDSQMNWIHSDKSEKYKALEPGMCTAYECRHCDVLVDVYIPFNENEDEAT